MRRSGTSAALAPALLLVLAAAALPLAGRARAANAELRTSLTVEQNAQSNVRQRKENEESDLFTQVVPRIVLGYRSEVGDGTAGLQFRARRYTSNDDLDAVDRVVNLDGRYRPAPRWELESTGSYAYYDDTNWFESPATGGGEVRAAGSGDSEALEWGGRAEYELSRRTRFSLAPSVDLLQVGQPNLPPELERFPGLAYRALVETTGTDLSSLGGKLALEHDLSLRDQLELSIGVKSTEFSSPEYLGDLAPPASFRDLAPGEFFDRIANQSSESRTGSASLGWTRAWSPAWSTTVSLGLQNVTSDERAADLIDFCFGPILDFQLPRCGGPVEGSPALLDAGESTSLVQSGVFELSRLGKMTTWTLRYQNDVQPSSSYGTNFEVQTYSMDFGWRINRKLTLGVGGYLSDYSSVGTARLPYLRYTDPTDPLAFDFVDMARGAVARPRCGGLPEVYRLDDAFAAKLNDEGIYERRPLVSSCVESFEADSELDYQHLGFSATLNWQLSRRFSTFVRYRYQERTSSSSGVREFADNVVTLGFTYNHDIDLY